MFDSIFLNIKCTFCGQTSEMECQTKELDCQLKRFHVGDNINTPGIDSLECTAMCLSEECKGRAERRQGFRSGGSLFDVIIETPLGLVAGKYKISEHQPFYYNL